MEGELRCFVHTRDNRIIRVNSRTKLPRNTDRFTRLIENLYEHSVIPPLGPPLLSLGQGDISTIIKEQHGDITVALTTEGTPKSMSEVARILAEHKRPVILIGGFPEGHFSKPTMQNINQSFRVDKRRLEASTIVARAVYDYERAIGR